MDAAPSVPLRPHRSISAIVSPTTQSSPSDRALIDALPTRGRPRRFPSIRPALPILGVVAVALALRGAEAVRKSLWIDELHTLDVAHGGGAADVIRRLLPDVHAPLFFLAVHALGDLAAHALRLLPILLSVATFFPLFALMRAARFGSLGTIVAGAAFAALPFQVQYGAELRPYAWLQFFVVLMAWAALTEAPRPRRRAVVFAVVSALALYTHYLAAIPILAIGFARCLFHPRGSLPLRSVILAGTAGVLLFLPWVLYDEDWIITDPGRMARNENLEGAVPKGLLTRTSEAWPELKPDVVAVLPRTLIPSRSKLGPGLDEGASISLAILAAAFILGAIGSILGRRRNDDVPRPERGGAVRGAIIVAGLACLALTLAACVLLWQRIALQYFVTGGWVWPLILGILVEECFFGPVRRITAMLALAGCILGGIVHVAGHSREDLRAGVETAVALADGTRSRFTTVLWQPGHYSSRTLYGVYAPQVQALDLDEIAPGAEGEPPLIVVTRNAPFEKLRFHAVLWGDIPKGRRLIRKYEIDPVVAVYVFASGS